MFGMTEKLDRFLSAIIAFEGYHTPDKIKYPFGSKAFRNKNPGNLRKSPFSIEEKDGFAVFRNDLLGYMALQWDIIQKAKGNTTTGLNSSSTIRDFVKVWAPASDNNDEDLYYKFIMNWTRFPEDFKLGELLKN